jgi:hypothetical protein
VPDYLANSGVPRAIFRELDWHLVLQGIADLIEQALGPLAVTLPPAERPASTTRNVRVAPGTFINAAGAHVDYAGETITLAAGTTRHLWLDDAGFLIVGAAWPATRHVRLAVVVVGVATITSIADRRAVGAGGT